MNLNLKRPMAIWASSLLACVVCAAPALAQVQPRFAMAQKPVPGAQRNALQGVESQVNWLLNATRTAANFSTGGDSTLRERFDAVRASYNGFKNTLSAKQLQYGANDLAELDAGLDIIQEAFVNYRVDLANRRSKTAALNSLCRVLREAMTVWWTELKQDSVRLRVGMS